MAAVYLTQGARGALTPGPRRLSRTFGDAACQAPPEKNPLRRGSSRAPAPPLLVGAAAAPQAGPPARDTGTERLP
jgi:hypothetical protein